MNRVKTHIPGIDELIQGGLPKGSCILLSGTAGTGKTIFALQFANNGIQDNEKSLYVSFEQSSKQLVNQASQFGWHLDSQKNFTILHIPPEDIKESTASQIVDQIKSQKYDRVVIDSISALSINAPSTYVEIKDMTSIVIQRFIYQFISKLRSTDATILLIAQTSSGKLSQDSVSEFACDGIFHIVYEPLGGSYNRMISIKKMRETKNNEDVHPLEINDSGVRVHTIQ